MAGCRTLSNDGFELDGLNDLLSDREQDLFDLAAGRDGRREQKGYVTPAQARAFLQSARQVDRSPGAAPPRSPIAHAYFRDAAAFVEPSPEENQPVPNAPALLPASGDFPASAPDEPPASIDERAAAIATVLDVLVEAGVVNQQPRGLLAAAPDGVPRLAHLHTQLELAREIDPVCVGEADRGARLSRQRAGGRSLDPVARLYAEGGVGRGGRDLRSRTRELAGGRGD